MINLDYQPKYGLQKFNGKSETKIWHEKKKVFHRQNKQNLRFVISVSIDLWTNKNYMESLWSFTAVVYRKIGILPRNTTNETFSRITYSQNIKNYLEEIPPSRSSKMTKILEIVRDNGRNVTRAIDDFIFKEVSYFLHTFATGSWYRNETRYYGINTCKIDTSCHSLLKTLV